MLLPLAQNSGPAGPGHERPTKRPKEAIQTMEREMPCQQIDGWASSTL